MAEAWQQYCSDAGNWRPDSNTAWCWELEAWHGAGSWGLTAILQCCWELRPDSNTASYAGSWRPDSSTAQCWELEWIASCLSHCPVVVEPSLLSGMHLCRYLVSAMPITELVWNPAVVGAHWYPILHHSTPVQHTRNLPCACSNPICGHDLAWSHRRCLWE